MTTYDLPERGRLTDALVAWMRTQLDGTGIVFGDQVTPPEAGYHKGQEAGDDDGFVASVVLTTSVAVPIENAPDPVRANHSSWKMVYGLRSTGGDRSQADFAADKARRFVTLFPATDVSLGGLWRVQRLLFTRLAAMREVRGQDVPTFALDDVVEVWVVRERGSAG